MQGTIRYVVKMGDWLAKIAEEHGTTVGAVWNHVKGGTAPRGYALGSQSFATAAGAMTILGVVARSGRPISSAQDPLLDLDIDEMQRRRRVLAALFRNLPRSATPPHLRRGIKPDYDQGEFQQMLEAPTDGKSNSCTNVAGAMMASVAGPGLYAYNIHKSPGFFPYEKQSMPSVGDNYVLWDRDKKERHHTGIVVASSSVQHAFWYTADGGQRDIMTPLALNSVGKVKREPTPASNEAAFIVPRIFGDKDGVGRLGNLHRWPAAARPTGFHIEGWLDITHPRVPFAHLAYVGTGDHAGTEDDYQNMRKRIARVHELFKKDRRRAQEMQAKRKPS